METNNEKESKKLKRNSSQVMELKQLIGGPLVAAVEAEALSTQKYLDYLMQVTFESYDPASGKTGKIRMLSFNYKDQSEGKSVERTVNIPLITLVPFPLLHIEEADFDFDIKIVDSISESYDEKFSISDGKSVSGAPESSSFRMRASLAPHSGNKNRKGDMQQSLSANMKVKVKMRTADMPAGLSNLLHLAANNLTTTD